MSTLSNLSDGMLAAIYGVPSNSPSLRSTSGRHFIKIKLNKKNFNFTHHEHFKCIFWISKRSSWAVLSAQKSNSGERTVANMIKRISDCSQTFLLASQSFPIRKQNKVRREQPLHEAMKHFFLFLIYPTLKRSNDENFHWETFSRSFPSEIFQ